MTVFCCASTIDGSPLPETVERQIQSTLAIAGMSLRFGDATKAIWHVDSSAWKVPEYGDTTPQYQVLIAGDPVYRDEEGSFIKECKAVAEAIRRRSMYELRAAEGTYCGVSCDLPKKVMTVITDKLGARPVYYGVDKGIFFAANALWILERIDYLGKRPNWRAAAEIAAFGYPLRDRSPYLEIHTLEAGSMVCCVDGEVGIRRYWDWRDEINVVVDRPDLVTSVEKEFEAAIDARRRGANLAVAYLSGGMDSRLIVTFLRHRGVAVDSINCAPSGTADRVLGGLAARALGVVAHHEIPTGTGTLHDRRMQATQFVLKALRSDGARGQALAKNVVWAGDGGSVGLGHVYLTEAIVETARNRGLQEAAVMIRSLTTVIPTKILNDEYHHLSEVAIDGILEELHSYRGVEAGRLCHLFFMLNDQHRHIAVHYERIHDYKLDFALPFFDGRFLKLVLSSPVTPFLAHKLYNRLMARQPFSIGQVPWQAYPGHEPGPTEVPAGLRDQWTDSSHADEAERVERASLIKLIVTAQASGYFPRCVLRRFPLFVAALLTWMGRDYVWVLRAAKPFIEANHVSVAGHLRNG